MTTEPPAVTQLPIVVHPSSYPQLLHRIEPPPIARKLRWIDEYGVLRRRDPDPAHGREGADLPLQPEVGLIRGDQPPSYVPDLDPHPVEGIVDRDRRLVSPIGDLPRSLISPSIGRSIPDRLTRTGA